MTYSIGTTGIKAHSQFAKQALTLSDAQAPVTAQQQAMQQGLFFLCKNPDGSSSYYRLDAERSTPANPILIAMGP